MEDSKKRLDTLDGLRAVAALGVLWIHTWAIHGNPRFTLGGIDITSILALGGNGVDLFFVISGFCMYYFYANKTSFNYLDFWIFLKKRWIRLSPAFYFATIIYILFRLKPEPLVSIGLKFLTSVFYINSFSKYNAEGFFWSLGAEWQFYVLIPFIFILQHRIGFLRGFALITSILFVVAIASVLYLKSGSDILTDQILFRYFEFACGIILARVILFNSIHLNKRAFWLFGFILITYTGRILLSGYIQSLSPQYYNIIKLLGFTVMSAGFTGIVYLSITSTKWLRAILGNKAFGFLGKISYSFYLWHGIVHVVIGQLVISNLNIGGILPAFVTFSLSTIILIPVSYLSFLLLEKPFLSRRKLSPQQQHN